MKCVLCGYEADGKAFSNHVRKAHGLKSIEYTAKYLYDGVRPGCEKCGDETRYVSFTFKRYCKAHATLAETLGGAKGGSAPAWNAGRTKHDDARLAKQAMSYSGSGNPFFGRKHTIAALEKMRNERRLTRDEFEARCQTRSHELLVLTPYDEYRKRQGQYLDVQCVSCDTTMKRTLETFERGSACPKCFPQSSKAEREVGNFVESLGFTVERNVRHVITPKELDVFVPSKRFAIEFNGLYAHMQGGHFNIPDISSHAEKTRMARRNDIRIMHIFSDEWRDKRRLFEEMIKARLGLCKVSRASKYNVVELPVPASREFFDKNHAAGFVGAMKHYALTSDDDIVAAMSFRVPRHRCYSDTLEVARFATKAGHRVLGAAGRLMKRGIRLAIDAKMKRLLSYADLRFGDGDVYSTLGFELCGETRLDYWLTDGRNRYDRFKFRARHGMTQREIEAAAGVHRIYGCGSRRYVMDLNII